MPGFGSKNVDVRCGVRTERVSLELDILVGEQRMANRQLELLEIHVT